MDQTSTPWAIDLCCGMGGLSLAARQLGMRIVAGVDLNASALKTFSKNFPEAEAIKASVGSTKALSRCAELHQNAKKVGSPVIIVSGPPCQGFSVAGSRDPSDPRNQVLTKVACAVAALQPECALVENVPAIFSDDYAKRLDKFKGVLSDGGYYVLDLLLDAREFGVPQKRRRAFFLITHNELSLELVLDDMQKLKQPQIHVKAALRGLPSAMIRPDDYDDEADNARVPNHFAMQHSPRVMRKIAAIEPGKGPMSYRRLHPERVSKTLFSGHRAPPAHYSEPRSITVREAARLQGFPDSFRVYGSFGKQMEQVTNAVPPRLHKMFCASLQSEAVFP